MKIIKNIDFKCIEINFEYNEQIITIKFEPYRTIDYVKEKVLNKLIIVPKNINLYYLGKNLSQYHQEKIGNIFKNKEKVKIKLKSSDNSNYSPSPRKIINDKSSKYLDYKNMFLNDNLLKYKEKKNKNLSKDLTNKSQNNINLINIFDEKIKKIKVEESNKSNFSKNNSEIKLPVLKNISLIGNIRANKNKSNTIIKRAEFHINSYEVACNCGRHNISEYCRNCKKFICIECRNEQKHRNHLFIKLNINNMEESIKSYGRQIQEDIEKKIDMNKNVFNNNNENSDEYIDISKRKERIINKYKKVIKFYQKIMTKIDNKLKMEDKERASLVVDAYNDLSQKMNKQLIKLLDKLNKDYINCGKEIMINDLRSFFDEINSKEETLSFLGKDIIKYHLKNEINTKLNSSLDKIDRILDEITDDNIPFNLDNKYYEELIQMEIIKNQKDNKEKEFMSNTNNIRIRNGHSRSVIIKNEHSKGIGSEENTTTELNNRGNLRNFTTKNIIVEE